MAKLKIRKVADVYNTNAELLKICGPVMVHGLNAALTAVWQSNYTSLPLKAVGHPHLKKERDCQYCNIYQDTITLHCTRKVLSHLLFIKNSEPITKVAKS